MMPWEWRSNRKQRGNCLERSRRPSRTTRRPMRHRMPTKQNLKTNIRKQTFRPERAASFACVLRPERNQEIAYAPYQKEKGRRRERPEAAVPWIIPALPAGVDGGPPSIQDRALGATNGQGLH